MKKNSPLLTQLEIITEKCMDCGRCQKDCIFLKKHGTPVNIAASCDPSSIHDHRLAYECSLCGLCAAVCPSGVEPASLFLTMRNHAVKAETVDLSSYKGLLGYERVGTSKRFTWYGLPEGCDTVFFPGCSLPGTRPEATFRIHEHLKDSIPALGIVLDCCTKPSQNIGREDFFNAMFLEMRDFLVDQGIKQVLVACPNCYNVFKKFGGSLSVKTIYECLAEHPAPELDRAPDTVVSVHDPCVLRFEPAVHEAVRQLIAEKGIGISEMPHARENTLCCGEGGAVGCVAPELSGTWTRMRKEEAEDHRIITYCAGCAGILSKETPADHLVDLFFEPEEVFKGGAKITRGPLTYLNRLRLKKRFRRNISVHVERERPAIFEKPAALEKSIARKGLAQKALLLALIALGAFAMGNPGVKHFLNPVNLRQWIEGCGPLAPAIYMLGYTLAPALFLPGLPMTLLGGVLFGPFWGVVYAITGATSGACLSFLISRHIARGWIEARLTNSKWQKLDQEVEQHGWKVVAITRLIPLFPFNLLNYAFGLTRIGFLQYAAATFVCMLPACIAFIVFSSSLGDLIRGRVSTAFIVGVGLIVLVSMLPLLHKKMSREKKVSF